LFPPGATTGVRVEVNEADVMMIAAITIGELVVHVKVLEKVIEELDAFVIITGPTGALSAATVVPALVPLTYPGKNLAKFAPNPTGAPERIVVVALATGWFGLKPGIPPG
jgi:hypothetical protein